MLIEWLFEVKGVHIIRNHSSARNRIFMKFRFSGERESRFASDYLRRNLGNWRAVRAAVTRNVASPSAADGRRRRIVWQRLDVRGLCSLRSDKVCIEMVNGNL